MARVQGFLAKKAYKITKYSCFALKAQKQEETHKQKTKWSTIWMAKGATGKVCTILKWERNEEWPPSGRSELLTGQQ